MNALLVTLRSQLRGVQIVSLATVALLICAADWLMLASLWLRLPTAYVVAAAGLLCALLAITISVYAAARALVSG